MRSILRDANFAPPLALRQLAQITDFDLFVTTTFDPLLEQAINDERFGGAQSTEVIAYAPNRVADLPTERDRLQRPVVYHLLGRAVGVAHVRDLRRGHARVHLRAAERAPDAREALPRARAQPPAAHRQQLHQLARASLPAHGQAPPPLRPARRGRGAGRQPFGQRRAPDGLPAAGERAHARLQRRREVRRRAAPPLDDAPRAGRGDPAGRRAAALPAPRARDARQRGLHQLRARGPAGGAEAQGRARRRRRQDLVRPRAARGRRRLRPQDPAATSPAARISSRSSRRPPSAGSKATSGASGATRSTATRNMADERGLHPARVRRRHRAAPARACPTSSSRCTSRGCRAARSRRSSRAGCRTCSSSRGHERRRRRPTAHEPRRLRPGPDAAAHVGRSTRSTRGWASPRSPRRRAATSTAARTRSPSSRAACSASC